MTRPFPSASSPLLPLGVLLLSVVVLFALLWLAPGALSSFPAMSVDGRRDLLLDQESIELGPQFFGRSELSIWHDAMGVNPDRPEVAVTFPRSGSLLWKVHARTGRFVTQVARLGVDDQGDESPAVFRVEVLREDGSPTVPTGPVMEVEVLSLPAGRGPSTPPWVEGPATIVDFALPEGAQALRLTALAPEGHPPGAALALLSPHIQQNPLVSRRRDAQQNFLRTERLLGEIAPCRPADEVVIGQRRNADGDEEDVLACPVEAVGLFTGRQGRPSLVLLEDAEASFEVTIHPKTVLAGAIALDDRMPAGAGAILEIAIDGDVLSREVVVAAEWLELRVPLGAFAGLRRVLTLRLVESEVDPQWVSRREIDFVAGREVENRYRMSLLRAGISNPRLERPASVQRRLATTEHPSVIVLHIETLRADSLPAYGGEEADLTPTFDRLVAEGVLWETAIAPSPWTLPSTATLLTGLLPSAHGVVDHDRAVLPPGVATLAERSQEAGVATGGFFANDLLQQRAGFGRGFQDFAVLPYANAAQVNALAGEFLQDHVDQQSLLVLHYWDPHHVLNAPEPFKNRFVSPDLMERDPVGAAARIVESLQAGRSVSPGDSDVRYLKQRYLGEVAWLDSQIGELVETLDRLEMSERTILVITADHGEEFLEHGLLGHGSHLFDESVRVPLLIVAPGGQWGPSRRIKGVVSTAGLHATILEALSVPYDREAVRPPLSLDQPAGMAFMETDKGVALDGRGDMLRRRMTAVRTDDHLLVVRHPLESGETWERDLYDLRVDPGASRPLGATEEAFHHLEDLRAAALLWSAERNSQAMGRSGDLLQGEILRAIGYVGSSQKQETPPAIDGKN